MWLDLSVQPDDVVNVAVEKINGLLENFMGINDTELGRSSRSFSIQQASITVSNCNRTFCLDELCMGCQIYRFVAYVIVNSVLCCFSERSACICVSQNFSNIH